MFIPGLIVAFLTLIAGLIVSLVGLIGYIVLKLMKEELNLKIKFGPDNEEQ